MTNQICFVVFTLCLLFSHPTLAGPGLAWPGIRNQSACMCPSSCPCACPYACPYPCPFATDVHWESFSQCKCKFALRCMQLFSSPRSICKFSVCAGDFCNEVEVHVACCRVACACPVFFCVGLLLTYQPLTPAVTKKHSLRHETKCSPLLQG